MRKRKKKLRKVKNNKQKILSNKKVKIKKKQKQNKVNKPNKNSLIKEIQSNLAKLDIALDRSIQRKATQKMTNRQCDLF